MTQLALNPSPVEFHEDGHSYTVGGKVLVSVTQLMKKHLFADKYDGIPEEILHRAARHGNAVHSACELADRMGITETEVEEVAHYLALCGGKRWTHVESEYIVSDGDMLAGSIDKVFADENGGIVLGDIKTTNRYDSDYVRWQLSIYAYLFELQNPGLPVSRIYGLWLRGANAVAHEESRIPSEEVERLLQCERDGTPYAAPLAHASENLPAKYAELESMLVECETQAKHWKQVREDMVAQLKEAMDATGVKKWAGHKATFTRTEDSERESFDAKAFRKDHPDLYNEYVKVSTVSGGIRITLKK